MHYVIIGNSAAAIGAVEGIRQIDKEGKITLISDEPYHTYSRPLISYYLAGKVSEDLMRFRNFDFYEKNNVQTLLGYKVTRLLPDENKLELEDGEVLSFDKLLIATGGKPFVPPIKGLGKEGIYSFLKLDDVKAIQEHVNPDSKVVILGAGLIGLKAAEGLRQAGAQVEVIELSNRVLSAILDEEAASIVQKHLEAQGIRFYLENTIEEIHGDSKVSGVTLKDGSSLGCDILIIAIGVVPNKDLTEGTGIEANRGIIVNETMATNRANIYAAGDVAEGYDIISKSNRVLPIWPNAYNQGEVAGFNMTGTEVKFPGGLAMNSIGFYGLPMITAGLIKPEGDAYEVLQYTDAERQIYKKIILCENKVVGFIFLSEVDRAGIFTSFIQEATDVSSFKDKLLLEDFGYIHLPQAMRKERMLQGGIK